MSEVKMRMGMVNGYVCSKLHTMVTVNMNDGSTSFVIQCRKCAAEGVNNMATSMTYQVDQKLKPEYEFYTPTDEDWKVLEAELPKRNVDAMKVFVKEKEGLLLRDKKISNMAKAESKKFLKPEAYEAFLNDAFNWSLETFPKADTEVTLQKLIEEAEESISSYRRKDGRMRHELADCLICLVIAAGYEDLTFDHLLYAAAAKMKINRSRKWQYDEVKRVYQHVATNR